MLSISLHNRKIREKIIRFRKKGIIRYPLYDIIVTYRDIRNRGMALEKLGFYNPNKGVKSMYINTYRLSYWLLKGVLINYTVRKHLVKFLLT